MELFLGLTCFLVSGYIPICSSIFSSLKLENGLKKHVRNFVRRKYGFAELIVILNLTGKSHWQGNLPASSVFGSNALGKNYVFKMLNVYC